jgi:hypothetical protein
MARICLAIDLSAIISAPIKKTPQSHACPLLNTGRYLHCLKRAVLYPEITMQSDELSVRVNHLLQNIIVHYSCFPS